MNHQALLYYKLLKYYQVNPEPDENVHIGNILEGLRDFIIKGSSKVEAQSHLFSTRFCCGCGHTSEIPLQYRITSFHVHSCFNCIYDLPSRVYSKEFNPVALLGNELSYDFQLELDTTVKEYLYSQNKLK